MKEKIQTQSNRTGSGRGGARPGAGRPRGATTKKTREIADKAVAAGLSPLEYMLNLMRSQAPEGADGETMLKHMALQFEAAKAAAPYVHPRLTAIAHTGENGGPIKTEDVTAPRPRLAPREWLLAHGVDLQEIADVGPATRPANVRSPG